MEQNQNLENITTAFGINFTIAFTIIVVIIICNIIAFFVFLGIGDRVKQMTESLKDIYFKLDAIEQNTKNENSKTTLKEKGGETSN